MDSHVGPPKRPYCFAGAATPAPFLGPYLAATMVDIPRDVIDVLTQLLAFLGRQLALRRPSIGILSTAVLHRGGAAAAFFATTAVRRTLPTPFLLRAGLHCVSAAEKTAESAKATAFTARVRLRTGRTEGKNTGQQRRAPPKHHRAIRKRKLRSHVFVAGNRCAMHHCATIDNRQPHCTPVPSAGVDRPQTVARNCQGSVAARPTDCSRDSVNNVTVCFNWAFTAFCCPLGPCFCRYH